jgi:hypothetical protein
MKKEPYFADVAFYILHKCVEVVDPEGEFDCVFNISQKLVDETVVTLGRKLKKNSVWVEDLLAAIGIIRSFGFEKKWMEEAIKKVKMSGLNKVIDEAINEVKDKACAETKILIQLFKNGDAIVVSFPEAVEKIKNGNAKILRVLKI